MLTLRFVSHPGPFNVAVRWAQYGFWASHVEAVMPDGRYLGSRFLGARFLGNPSGVQARPASYDAGEFSQEQFVRVKATPAQEIEFFAFLTAQLGKPYDWRAIITFLDSRDWQEPDSWFCSELIAAALASCGIFPRHLAVQFDRITVRDVFILVSTLTEGASA